MASIAKSPQGMACVSLKSLRPGCILKSPIIDHEKPVLLIAAGIELTATHLENLLARGVTRVRVGLADLAGVVTERPRSGSPASFNQTGRSAELADLASSPTNPTKWSGGKPFLSAPRSDHSAGSRKRLDATFSGRFKTSMIEIRTLFEGVASGSVVNTKLVVGTAESALVDMSEDFDFYLRAGLKPDTDQYPFSHALQTARLAMAMGAMLGIDKQGLVEMGTGCMLHDIGMLRLDRNVLNCEQPLNQIQRLEITKHPAITFDSVHRMFGLSMGSRMVAYQMHERLDGSGYPRGRTAAQIHPWAKIAMIADSLIAMTSPRPHRPAMLPYDAMVELLAMTRNGKLDLEAIKGLLRAVSLFPLGSFVELSDGRTGNVIGANGEQFTRPIVEISPDDFESETEVVNLVSNEWLTIVRAVIGPRAPGLSSA